MAETGRSENPGMLLRILDSVEKDGEQSQRHLASELGVALGLVNVYLKRCVKKGLVKASQAPARRYIYYLTPLGFAEKSRLTVEYLSYSFGFFRLAKADCAQLFQNAKSNGLIRIALAGKSDLAEIAAICALESDVRIVAVVDVHATSQRFMNFPLVRSFDDIAEELNAVVVTDLQTPRETCEAAIIRFGADRVLIPQLLRIHLTERPE